MEFLFKRAMIKKCLLLYALFGFFVIFVSICFISCTIFIEVHTNNSLVCFSIKISQISKLDQCHILLVLTRCVYLNVVSLPGLLQYRIAITATFAFKGIFKIED